MSESNAGTRALGLPICKPPSARWPEVFLRFFSFLSVRSSIGGAFHKWRKTRMSEVTLITLIGLQGGIVYILAALAFLMSESGLAFPLRVGDRHREDDDQVRKRVGRNGSFPVSRNSPDAYGHTRSVSFWTESRRRMSIRPTGIPGLGPRLFPTDAGPYRPGRKVVRRSRHWANSQAASSGCSAKHECDLFPRWTKIWVNLLASKCLKDIEADRKEVLEAPGGA